MSDRGQINYDEGSGGVAMDGVKIERDPRGLISKEPTGAEMIKQAKNQPAPDQPEPEVQEEPEEGLSDDEIDAHLKSMSQPTGEVVVPKLEFPPIDTEEPQYEVPKVAEPTQTPMEALDDVTDEQLENMGLTREGLNLIKQLTKQSAQKTVEKKIETITKESEQEDLIERRHEANREVYKKYPVFKGIDIFNKLGADAEGAVDPKDHPIYNALTEAYKLVDLSKPEAPIHAMEIAETKLGIKNAQAVGAEKELERQSRTKASSALTTGGNAPARKKSGENLKELSSIEKEVASKMRISNSDYASKIGNNRRVTGPDYYEKYRNAHIDPRMRGNK